MRFLNFTEYSRLDLNESYNSYTESLNENIKYHIENNLDISESIFRIGSDSYLDFVNELRELHKANKIHLSEEDTFIVEKLQTGKKGTLTIKGKKTEVTLDDPHIRRKDEPGKLFVVYRPHKDGKKDPKTGLVKAVAIGFGEETDAGKDDIRQKHQDPARRKAFLARHGCSKKTNMYASGWWSCNVHKFWKQLGLKTNDPW